MPVAVSALFETVALARPLIWFRAVAPPPENPNALLEALSATVIALAFEVASIEVASVTSTVSEPPFARTSGTSVMNAWTSLWLSLRERLRPTATDVALPKPAPIAIAGATTCEVTLAVESALTSTSPAPAITCGEPLSEAWTCAESRFMAITASTAIFLESLSVTASKAVAADSMSASISASEVAFTRTAPPASSVDPVTLAIVLAGCSEPRMVAPEIASSVLKSRLVGAQPIELKASVMPIARPCDLVSVVYSAVIVDAFSALTVMSWPAPVVRIALPAIVALAPLSITLAATWKAMPFVLPSANGLPPSVSATTSPVACSVAVSIASTARAPAAVTVMPLIDAFAPPRTSLRATAPAAALAGEALTFGRYCLRASIVSPTVTFLKAGLVAAVARLTVVPFAPVKR